MERLSIDLISKYNDTIIYDGVTLRENFEAFKQTVKGFTNSNENLNLKTGDTIGFMGGFNNDIEFTSEILGFDIEGNAFVLWDCYWFAIDLSKRLIAEEIKN